MRNINKIHPCGCGVWVGESELAQSVIPAENVYSIYRLRPSDSEGIRGVQPRFETLTKYTPAVAGVYFVGAPSESRTPDTMIKSPVLYLLS